MQPEPRVRRFSIISVVAAAVLIFGTASAGATTYYVSQSSGNDRWTGRAPSPKGTRGPWKTLARASTDYVAGDRILLKCGDTWNEELHPKGSGTPGNPIVIGSYAGGAKPVIDRQDYTKDLIGIHLADQAGYKIVGIEFARCMTGIYAEYSDGLPTRRFIWIEDCYFRDSLKYGHYETYPNPRNIGLGICFFSHERDNKIVLTDITITNCVFRRLASAVWTNSPDNFNKNASYIYNFGNMTFEGCLFEEGYQWQLGIRGVAGGAVRNCVTHDIGRGFRAFNGVAGAMFFRCKNWVFEDSEWGFIDIGLGSADGEAFDFEGNCDNMTMRRCLFHDTDGPCFLLCCYASDGHPNMGIRMENCVLNGKSKRPIGLPRCEIINTTDWNEATWEKCRFYLSEGEVLMRVMDPEKEKRTTFVDCVVKNLRDACTTANLAAKATASASSQAAGREAAKAIDGDAATFWKAASANDQWLQLDFAQPTTVNEFKIKEDPSSSVIRYTIQYWDDEESRWVGCFNGRAIGHDFVAPIVSRTTRKVRLSVARTTGGTLCIGEFEAYDDTARRPRKAAGPVQAGLPKTVPVGNPGNRADDTGYGAVAYPYEIGKYEVTSAQYCEFLNAVAKTDTYGLYNMGMAGEYGGITQSGWSGSYTYAVKPGMGNKPVNFVSWYDALRYANWLTNGRGDGSTEMGCYTLANDGGNWKVTMPDHAAMADGKVVKWVLPSEDEWYKAAHYDPGKPGGAGYWRYAVKSDNAPAANYNTNTPTDVGSYTGSASAYGTFDQNGNMWEWNETRAGGNRGVRGGSFYLNDRADYLLSSSRWVTNPPTFEFSNYGFRVVALGAPGARRR